MWVGRAATTGVMCASRRCDGGGCTLPRGGKHLLPGSIHYYTLSQIISFLLCCCYLQIGLHVSAFIAGSISPGMVRVSVGGGVSRALRRRLSSGRVVCLGVVSSRMRARHHKYTTDVILFSGYSYTPLMCDQCVWQHDISLQIQLNCHLEWMSYCWRRRTNAESFHPPSVLPSRSAVSYRWAHWKTQLPAAWLCDV